MGMHPIAGYASLTLARVTDTKDPDARGRVKVKLVAVDMELWAEVAVASAGKKYGVHLLPKIDEVVVVAFLDPEMAVVMGALWTGSSPLPAEAGEVEKRYSITMPSGSVLYFDDDGQAKVVVTTPAGPKVTITDEAGGKIMAEVKGNSVTITTSKVEIQASSEVTVQAGQVKVSAGMVTVDAGMSKFSGVVKCDTLIANSVVGSSYTPGAGNIW